MTMVIFLTIDSCNSCLVVERALIELGNLIIVALEERDTCFVYRYRHGVCSCRILYVYWQNSLIKIYIASLGVCLIPVWMERIHRFCKIVNVFKFYTVNCFFFFGSWYNCLQSLRTCYGKITLIYMILWSYWCYSRFWSNYTNCSS